MEEALAEYASARAGEHAWMLGRFIVNESRLNDVIVTLSKDEKAKGLSVSVILDAGKDARAWFGRVQAALARISALRGSDVVRVEALEVPLPELLWTRETYDAPIGQFAAAAAQAGLRALPAFVELPRDERWGALLPGATAALQRHRLGGKLRCGGIGADATPYPSEIAAFVHAAAQAGIPFKATAGLHHPVRGYNEASGYVMHGFLNILTAAALAREGADADELGAVVEDEEAAHFRFDAGGLHWQKGGISGNLLQETRYQSFISYGSCSFAEPVADLQTLGMIG